MFSVAQYMLSETTRALSTNILIRYSTCGQYYGNKCSSSRPKAFAV